MALTSGTRLGNYEIIGPLGKGGMGEVYRAKDTKLGREVAIKVLPAALANDADRLGRFEREAKVLASLNHPNIATIYGLEESAEGKAIAMELVEGATLKSPLPLNDALKIAVQIAEALEAAHEKGVTHRDLKPANIMVTPSGLVKVLDFGLAAVAPKSSGDKSDSANAPTMTMGMTESGVVMGTAAYMSPEQAVGHPVDKRTDIWAFGVVLWEMLTGKGTFSGDTVAHILEHVIRAEVDFSQLSNKIPSAIRELLRRCLDRDVHTRLRDIGEARVTIQKYLAHPEEATAASGPVTVVKSPMGWLWPAVAGVGVVAAAVLALVHFREKPEVTEMSRFEIPLLENMNWTGATQFALSPDGRRLVFTAAVGSDRPSLWVRSMDSLMPQMIPETAFGAVPFWSPDGRYLAFTSGGKLKRIDMSAGGAPQTIMDLDRGFGGGSWNKDNVIVFGTNQGLKKIPASGGTPVLVSSAEGRGTTDAFPDFLPDGIHFLYLKFSPGDPKQWGVYLGSINRKPEEQSKEVLVHSTYAAAYSPSIDGGPGYVLFLNESTLMAQAFDEKSLKLQGDALRVAEGIGTVPGYGFFSVSKNGALAYRRQIAGNTQLTWYTRKGDKAGTVGDPAKYSNVKISPDGTKAIVLKNGADQLSQDFWQADLAHGNMLRVTFDPNPKSGPAWSPDGNRVAYQSNRNGKVGIYARAANGSGAEELLYEVPQRAAQTTDWTHDGKYLLYQATVQGNKRDIFAVPVGPGTDKDRKAIPLLQTPADEAGGYVSSDGKWLAYTSDETGKIEVYVQPFAPESPGASGKWLVSKGALGAARWRADGRELLFVGLNGELMGVDVAAGATFQYGSPHLLFKLPEDFVKIGGGAPGALMDAGRDGQRFLMVLPVAETARPQFFLEQNWQAGLRK